MGGGGRAEEGGQRRGHSQLGLAVGVAAERPEAAGPGAPVRAQRGLVAALADLRGGERRIEGRGREVSWDGIRFSLLAELCLPVRVIAALKEDTCV